MPFELERPPGGLLSEKRRYKKKGGTKGKVRRRFVEVTHDLGR